MAITGACLAVSLFVFNVENSRHYPNAINLHSDEFRIDPLQFGSGEARARSPIYVTGDYAWDEHLVTGDDEQTITQWYAKRGWDGFDLMNGYPTVVCIPAVVSVKRGYKLTQDKGMTIITLHTEVLVQESAYCDW
jgi:hypothetical protein